jgi:hypothetical protein
LHIPAISGSANPVIAMTCAAPKRDAPAALQLPENSSRPTLEPGKDAIRTFTIFHGWVRPFSVHARFYKVK